MSINVRSARLSPAQARVLAAVAKTGLWPVKRLGKCGTGPTARTVTALVRRNYLTGRGALTLAGNEALGAHRAHAAGLTVLGEHDHDA